MTLLTLLLTQTGFAATHTVDASGDGDFSTLQAAVDAAMSGDTIEVAPGTYTENVSVSAKTLVIEGSGVDATILQGDGSDTVMMVTSGGLNLSHMTITGGTQGLALRGVVGSLTSVEVDSNTGSEQGGGVSITDGADLNLTAVIITNNSGSDGGGLYLDAASQAELTDIWLEGNSATGSGGAAYTAGKVQLMDSDIYNNDAAVHGGGLFSTGLSPEVLTSKFWGNTAGENGGAIAVNESSTGSGVNPRFKEVEFWLNEAGTSGGAIWMNASGLFYFKQLLVVLNAAGEDGGGIWVSGGQPTSTFVRAWHNEAGNHGGGAMFASNNGGLTRKSSFGGNIAGGMGGGAVHMAPNAAHLIYNNRYLENTAESGGGLMISGDPSKQLATTNVDVIGNTGGGVLFAESADMKLVNSIVAWNDGAGISADEPSTAGATLKHNDLYANTTAYGGDLSDLLGIDGNIDADPLYTRFDLDGNPISDFLTLTDGSPCSGTGQFLDGASVDMGSYGGAGSEGGDEDGDGVGPNGGDCDDGDALAAPGLEEVPGDARDNDCAGGAELDIDEDGVLYPIDCDDENADVYPGATDVPGDGIDADCDGLDGEADTGEPVGADTGAPWVDEDTGSDDLGSDLDGDGYVDDDCNDADPTANPDADEVCDDGIDNDCDGATDDADADCKTSDKGCGCAAAPSASSAPIVLLFIAGLLGRRRE